MRRSMVSATLTLIFGIILFNGCGNRSTALESDSAISVTDEQGDDPIVILDDVKYEQFCSAPPNAFSQE